jgi:bifunctional non-homologous end joining protein LigD
MAPLGAPVLHDEAHRYSKAIAQKLARKDIGRYTISSQFEARSGRLFIDYLRNGRGTTAVGTYSPRARPGFPIAAPVSWADLERNPALRPDSFSTTHLPEPRQGKPARGHRSGRELTQA